MYLFIEVGCGQEMTHTEQNGFIDNGDPPFSLYYNYIKNYIPELPKLDIGNDGTIDYEPQGGDYVDYSLFDFSEEINEYISDNQNEISNGFINVPLKFDMESGGNILIDNIEIGLIPDISDPVDIDTDTDEISDLFEEINSFSKFFLNSLSDFHFYSSPSIIQYTKLDKNQNTYNLITRIACGYNDGYMYVYNEKGKEIFKYDTTSPIYTSPAIININQNLQYFHE